MKITATQSDLESAIARVRKVVEARNTMPMLGNLLLRAEGARLSLTGTDLDTQITTTLPAEVATPGETTLPANMLLDFVRKLPKDKIVTLEDDGQMQCTVRGGRARARLHSLPAVDFPKFSSENFTAHITLPADRIADILTRTSFAASTEETRYYLCGIHLHPGEQNGAATLNAVATDGHRLALEATPMPEGGADMPGIIIPTKTAKLLADLVKGLASADVEIATTSTIIEIRTDHTTLRSKLIDGTFPDYARVIPSSHTTTAILDADALRASAALLEAVTNENGRSVYFDFGGEESPDHLTLSVSNPSAGDAIDALPMEIDGPPVATAYNIKYVLAMLAILPGTKIRFSLSEGRAPALVTADGHEGWSGVLMPMDRR